jgi:hypothetical protein
MDNIEMFNSNELLDVIENIFKEKGIDGVKEFIINKFPMGTLVHFNMPIESIYKISNRAMYKLDDFGNLTSEAFLDKLDSQPMETIIKVIALPYLFPPFQIELYGIKYENHDAV